MGGSPAPTRWPTSSYCWPATAPATSPAPLRHRRRTYHPINPTAILKAHRPARSTDLCRELVERYPPKVRREPQEGEPHGKGSGSRTLTGGKLWTIEISGYSASPAASGKPPSTGAS